MRSNMFGLEADILRTIETTVFLSVDTLRCKASIFSGIPVHIKRALRVVSNHIVQINWKGSSRKL